MKVTIDIDGNKAIINEWDDKGESKPVEVELTVRMKKLIEAWVNTLRVYD